MEQIGRRRRWRETLDHSQFNARLEQLRDATDGDNLGVHLTEALYRAIRTQIAPHARPHARPHDLLHFAIQAHGFAHAFRSANLQVGEFVNRGAYLDELLNTLAGKLNSNEEFHPDRGFAVDVVVVRMPTPGSGRGRKQEVGFRTWEKDSKRKYSIIHIKNQDALCCARAIVTTKAWIHRNDPGHMPWNDWVMLQKGLPRQRDYARQLHQAAGVPEGPCGLPELEAFQRHLAPTYQLKVMSRQHPFFIIYRGPEAPHIIRLLKSNDHYEGCKAFTGFTNRSTGAMSATKASTTMMRPIIPVKAEHVGPATVLVPSHVPTTINLKSLLSHASNVISSFMDRPVFSIIRPRASVERRKNV